MGGKSVGFQYEFNWMLKLSALDEQQLQVNHKYPFTKAGVRIFPLDMPVDLVNGNWEAVARCVINRITITLEETTGEFKVIEIYDKQKRELLTRQWRNLVKITKNMVNVEDFSKIHIT